MKLLILLLVGFGWGIANAASVTKNSTSSIERMRVTDFKAKKVFRIFETVKNGKPSLQVELRIPKEKTRLIEIKPERFQLIENLALEQAWENNFRSKSTTGKCEKTFEIRIQTLNERSVTCKGELKREFNTQKFFSQILLYI